LENISKNKNFINKLPKNLTYVGMVTWFFDQLYLFIKIDNVALSFEIKDYEEIFDLLSDNEVSLVDVNFYDGTEEKEFYVNINKNTDIMILIQEQCTYVLTDGYNKIEFIQTFLKHF
jgi:hypothetical protein